MSACVCVCVREWVVSEWASECVFVLVNKLTVLVLSMSILSFVSTHLSQGGFGHIIVLKVVVDVHNRLEISVLIQNLIYSSTA